jgi:GntR family transcriptional repressor for pyruvate dehydrogenase complex
MSEPARREERLYERVAGEVRALLASGRYTVGDKLPSERDLATQYKVSRPTVREAIIALELDGMVEVRTNSGVYVAALAPLGGAPGETDVGGFELLEARRLIESQVAALAASHISTERIGRLAALVADMERTDLMAAEAADREFHLEIARATGNSALEMTVATLWDTRSRSPQYRLLTEKVRAAGVAPRLSEHQAIVDALAAHDPGRAHDAMWEHLSRVIDALLEATEVEAVAQARAEVEAKRVRVRAPLAAIRIPAQ